MNPQETTFRHCLQYHQLYPNQSINNNMEDTSVNSNTDDQNVSNSVQNKEKNENEKESNAPAKKDENVSASTTTTTSKDATVESAKQTNIKTSTSISANEKPSKKKAVLLNAPNIETICDDITATTDDIKRLKHVQVRSNSTGKLYQSSRRVSFPENDSELVTGYLEPADPWACVKPATCVSELAEFYRESCKRHNALPIESIMKHLDTLDLNTNSRRPVLSLREQNLTAESCEALEEVLKRIQYKLIDLTDCGLNDASATALFDIIEYYEAANEIDISENRNITNRGWQACINMVKRSHALQILVTRGTPLSESNAISLGKSMLSSSLNTLKLEHCGLSGRPMASLCTYLRKNTVLKELWLAHNDLTADDAYNIGNVLKSNFFLQFLDLSNNNIQDRGVLHIAEALIEQANYFKVLHGSNPVSSQTLSSRHTLTRGDKVESKYEFLARLINASKPDTDTTHKPDLACNLNTTDRSIKKEEDSKPETIDEKKKTDDVKTSTKSDNNNSTIKDSASNVTDGNASQPDVYELKIVEKIEQSSRGSQNDNDDDSSVETSNSANSPVDVCDKTNDDTNAKEHVEHNNNEAADLKCNDNVNVLTNTEQSIETAAEQPKTQPKEDLNDSLDDTTQSPITNDCHLDINENKSDMKLNYAEVVKVENALEGQLCENKNFNAEEVNSSDHIDNKNLDSRVNVSNDLDEKVQSTVNSEQKVDKVKHGIGCSSPKPIQMTNTRHDDQDEEMSPVCKVRLPLNSPRLTKSKDIMGDLPLTPDSSHSLDSSCEYSTPFEQMRSYNASIAPERSFSSESLNSETSIESNDSKSSIKLAESKFSKNGTLERQINSNPLFAPSITTPSGLQVLMLWNNRITRDSAQSISKLLSVTSTLEILNVGKNVLSNDFVTNIATFRLTKMAALCGDEDEPETDMRTIKLGFKSIIKIRDLEEYLTDFFFNRSLIISKISYLASLSLLYQVNTALDNNYIGFFRKDGKTVIGQTFQNLVLKNVGKGLVPAEFRQWAEQLGGRDIWPNQEGHVQPKSYYVETYTNNVKNNMVTHCQTRIKYFIKIVVYEKQLRGEYYDNDDIRNVMMAITKNKDYTGDDPVRKEKLDALLKEITDLGFPPDLMYLKSWVKSNWFYSMWMFGQIQRRVSKFLEEKAFIIQMHNQYRAELRKNEKNKKPIHGMKEPPVKRPPHVKNFTVVPLCSAQLMHTRLDCKDVFTLVKRLWFVKQSVYNEKTGNMIYPKLPTTRTRNEEGAEFEEYQEYEGGEILAEKWGKEDMWGYLFDIDKIKGLDKKKDFHFQLLTDSVSVSLVYKIRDADKKKRIAKSKNEPVHVTMTEQQLESQFKYEIGIDPNVRTHLAVVRRDIKEDFEENFKVGNPFYHWLAEEGVRDRIRERLTGHVVRLREEQFRGRAIPPSPHSHHTNVWQEYIKIRLEMMEEEFKAYATRRYARLDFDHYLCSNRATDKLAVKITNNMPSIIYMGSASFPSNSPIGIKGRKRAPGSHKFIMSVKKLGHSVIKKTDEYMTSQTCANCYKRFPDGTKKHRFKVCKNCDPPPDAIIMPRKIYTTRSRRELKRMRREVYERGEDAHRFVADGRLVTKWKTYYKKWPRRADKKPTTVVWHRDIVAAKNILIKGHCKLLGREIPETLKRRPPQNVPNFRPDLRPIVRARRNGRNAPNPAILKTNTSLTSLGLQSVHLSNDGVKTLSEILDFGGNTTLQRVDLRDNNLQVSGLTSLNEVLKSNKSITRIDLDDVPRRVYEHSSDSSIDYSRVVNNIRSLCARNENPPDPEPIRTSVKRVRANFLNSRKISLTCQSIRNNTHDSPQAKAERLLDPARKTGRLRSPSPSPIPSPVSSPIPSPSRSSRFHVSRVVESNVSSPITPPSSNSCSPTSTSSSSRFRVTVVEPPKVMSAPVTIINSTHKENEKSIQKKDNTETATLPPQLNVLQRTQSAPSTTMASPSPSKVTTVEAHSPPKKDVKEVMVHKPTEQQHIATTTLTVIDNSGNSFDSPDLEVKGYMDDSCSSFSSLDSIDRGQDFNTSFSSYDILRENKFSTNSGKTVKNQPKQIIVTKTQSISPTDHLNSNQVENSASSLEASTCSNDSIYGSQEFPVLKNSSNEGTLTNSPVSPCSGEIANDKDSLSPKPDDKQQRVRKTSWISRGDAVPATIDKLLSIFHHPGNLFFPRSNNGDVVKRDLPQSQSPESKPASRKESPSGLFAWTKKENVFGEMADCKNSVADGASQKLGKPPLQSNMSPENTITADSVGIEAIPIQLKQDVKENTSPEHTVTADSMANLQTKTTQTLGPDISPKFEKTLIDLEQQVTENEKVHFEVGGDDDEDEFDESAKNEFAGIQVNAPDELHQTQPHTAPATNHVGKAFGLGQITRDSLSILKGSSNNSQDSMRSLESLSEIVFEET